MAALRLKMLVQLELRAFICYKHITVWELKDRGNNMSSIHYNLI